MRVSGSFRGCKAAAATFVFAAVTAGHIGSAQAAIPATSCSDLNGSVQHFNNGDPAFQITTGGSSFIAGQRITVTSDVGAATVSLTGAVAVTFSGSTTITVPTTGAFVESIASSTLDVNLTFTCTAGSGSAAGVVQPTMNAQVGVFNGQQTMRSYNDWVSKTIVASFGPAKRPPATAARLETLSAYATVKRLRSEERELTEELAEAPSAAVERKLAAVKQKLVFARAAVQISRSDAQDDRWAEQTAAEPQQKALPQISLGASDIAAFCAPGDDLGAFSDRKWNVWLEGRVVGASDSVLQNNVFGFNGSAGTDYKVTPWLAAGLSVGVESYETKFGTSGVRAGTVGLSVMPYVGVRLSDSVTASAFTGFTHLNYNTNPASNITAQFEALRLMLGGAVTGVWREDNWRFQPSLSGTFGSETQNAYVDSLNNSIAAQTLYYGRISAGPEVGYTFADPSRIWTIEPFVTAKLNVDFSSQPATVLNGSVVILRAGTQASGAMGAGAELRFADGFYFRAQGAYESIGVAGLDVWTALLRGGMSF